MSAETLGFQTEAKQLLHLMIHSLYSNKEIFLRELISNASDAVDKLRFEALADAALYEGDTELKVRVDVDVDAKTITISDNGIGMSREEAIDHLGTIAKSGTSQFLEGLSGDQQKDAQLIGQFGVGFYSSFIVADKVVVESRRAGLDATKGVRWSCEGEAEFVVEDIEKATRGTSITLHLKAEEADFANDWRLRSIVHKYSDHIAVPVEMKATAVADDDSSEEAEVSYESVNSATALWTRSRSEISDEEYKEFYKHISHDMSEPVSWSHNRVEGKFDYTSLLYIPSRAPFDLYNREGARGLKLYIQRTYIMDDAEQFLPMYLRFIKGVVDSNDLPLNVSREILQHSPAVDSIRGALVKRVLDELGKLAKSTDSDTSYGDFWKEFGQVLKEGVGEDFANRDKIAALLKFNSTHAESGDEQTVSLADYIDRMAEGQKKIYFLLAENLNAARNSTYLEAFRKKGVEVLLLSDRIDEWMVSYLTEFDGKSLQNVSKGELDESLFADQGEDTAEETASSTELAERIKTLLVDKVDEVRPTKRLTESPACLVYGDDDLGIQMRQILEASGQAVPETKPVLEINPTHPLLLKLETEADEAQSSDLAALLYDQAVLSAGEQLDNPAMFVKRLNQLLFAA